MFKKFAYSYLCILLILLCSLSLSQSQSEKLNSRSTSLLTPFWQYLSESKTIFFQFFKTKNSKKNHLLKEKIEELKIEKELLKKQLKQTNENMQQQLQILSKIDMISEHELQETAELKEELKLFLQRQLKSLTQQLPSLSARVIFRSFDQWNSSLWVDVGEVDNIRENKVVIAKNSPVLLNASVVGVIDYVEEKRARVRLISDSSITPSVRAVRGGKRNELFVDAIHQLSSLIQAESFSELTIDEIKQLIVLLNKLKRSLSPLKKSWYLAKGELQGSVAPIGYAPPILKGIGFNYDFDDEQGTSRDLREGFLKKEGVGTNLPILKVNDLLVTTGMDGIFPSDLPVAIVTKVFSLKEGDYFYELEAKPLAPNFESLSTLFILPPLEQLKKS